MRKKSAKCRHGSDVGHAKYKVSLPSLSAACATL